MELLVESLAVNRERLARIFRLPANIGIEMHTARDPGDPSREGLLLWVDRLAAVHRLPTAAQNLLYAYMAGGPQAMEGAAHLPLRFETTSDLNRVTDKVLAGWVALLVDNRTEALLLCVGIEEDAQVKRLRLHPREDVFARDMRRSVAMLRERLRTPDLLAMPVPFPGERAGGMALVYMEEKASPSVVRAVRRWAARHAGEEAAARGVVNPASAMYGLLPRFTEVRRVDHAAIMLDAGYVLLIIDRVETIYLAPVTLASWLTSPSDGRFHLPVRRWLSRIRLALGLLVMLLPGAVVALLNYHQEMIPTAFLLAVGSARENAPFATLFEVLLLELLTELSREASFRLPLPIPIGQSLLATVLIATLAVHSGFVGPLPALASVVGGLASLALPDPSMAYMVRFWRFIVLLGANTLGFFGMATIFALFVTYLSQARSWGVPFLGPSGSELTAIESWSSHAQRAGGGSGTGQNKSKAVVR